VAINGGIIMKRLTFISLILLLSTSMLHMNSMEPTGYPIPRTESGNDSSNESTNVARESEEEEVFDDDEDEKEEGEVAHTWTITFKNNALPIPENEFKRIKQLWNMRHGYQEEKEETGCYEFSIDGYMDNITESVDDITLHIDLTTESAMPDDLNVNQLIMQLKIANRLNNEFVLDRCAHALINKLDDTYTDETAEIIQKMIDNLPDDILNHELKPLLETKFSKQLTNLYLVETKFDDSSDDDSTHYRYRLSGNTLHTVEGSISPHGASSSESERPITPQLAETLTELGDSTIFFRILSKKCYVICGLDDHTINIYNFTTGELIHTLIGHTNTVKQVCMLDKDHIVSGSNDKTIKIWNITTGKCIKTLTGGKIIHLTILDGNRITILDGNRIRSQAKGITKIWDISRFQLVANLTFKQLAFIISLQHEYEALNQPVPITALENETEEKKEKNKIWKTLPEELKKIMINLGWVKLPLIKRIRHTIYNSSNTIYNLSTETKITLGVAIGVGAIIAGRYLWNRWRRK